MFADGSKLPGKIMPALALGVFLGALDMNILALALTKLQLAFDVSPSETVWVVTTFSLAYLVGMPIMGRLADLLGKKRMFRFGLALFTFGSLLCALSGWLGHLYWLLLAGRLVQGFGGGGIVPVANAIIGEQVPPERRGKALGVVGMCFAGASILGPILGGLLLDAVGWEWLFLLNVPVGLAAIALAGRRLPDTWPAARGRVDWLGGALLALSLASLMIGADLLAENLKLFYEAWHGWVPLCAVLSLVAGVAFLLRERAVRAPMLDLGLYRRPAVRLSFLLAFLYGVGMLVAMVFTPMYFHYRFDFNSIQAGLGLLPMAFAVGGGAMMGGRLSDRHGPRSVLLVGFALFTGGLALLAAFSASAPIVGILGILLLVGAGFGLCQAPLNHAVLRATAAVQHGQASGALNTHRSIGGILGATLGAVFIAQAMSRVGDAMLKTLGAALPPTCLIPRVVDPNHITEMLALLPDEARGPALAAARAIVGGRMVAGLTHLYWVGAAALAIAWLAAWWLPRATPSIELSVPAAEPEKPVSVSSSR